MDLRRFVAPALAAALSLALAGTAPAATPSARSAARDPSPSRTYEPPGKAGATEYAETLPASGGNVTPPPAGTLSTAAAGATASAPIAKLGQGLQGVRRDGRLGAAGQATAAFAQATAPPTVAHKAASANRSTNSARAAGRVPHPAGSGSVLAGMLDLLGGSDGGGIGVILPIALIFSLGLAIGFGARGFGRRADV